MRHYGTIMDWLRPGAIALGVLVALGAAKGAWGAPMSPGVAEGFKELRIAAAPPGWRPPPVSTVTVEGAAVTLAQHRGKVVLLAFWASWCVPCLVEMPAMEEVHRDYAGRGLVVVGLNVGEDVARIKRFKRLLGLSFPLWLDPEERFYRAYGVVGLPTTFLIGRNGLDAGQAYGPREWDSPAGRRLIEAMLGMPPGK